MYRYFLAALILLLASPSVLAMRCGSRVTSDGMQDFQVRERCGEPFWSESYSSVDVVNARTPIELQREVQYEVWYYNFGKRDLMRRLVFRDGVLTTEETIGYGVDEIGADCNPTLPYIGLSSGELVAHCGQPASHRQNNDTIVKRPAPGYQRWSEKRRELWVYDFGDDRFLRRLQLVDGRVTDVDFLKR